MSDTSSAPVNVRIPVSLIASVRVFAKAERRSTTNMVEVLIEDALRARQLIPCDDCTGPDSCTARRACSARVAA